MIVPSTAVLIKLSTPLQFTQQFSERFIGLWLVLNMRRLV